MECDETRFGGHRKGNRGWNTTGKIIVLGILQHNGMVRVFPVQGRKASEVIRLVGEHTKPGSLYYTDNWQAYGSLAVRGVPRKTFRLFLGEISFRFNDRNTDIFPLINKLLRHTGYNTIKQTLVRNH